MKIHWEGSFAASHDLKKLFGEGHKCSNDHGHTYRVVVEILQHRAFVSNIVLDFGALKGIVGELDHGCLNDQIEIPTAENTAIYILKKVKRLMEIEAKKIDLRGAPRQLIPVFATIDVQVFESPTNYASDREIVPLPGVQPTLPLPGTAQ